MRKLTIRWQLTLWYTGVLAVVLAGFGTAIYMTMRHQLLGRIDQGLEEELADVMSEVRRAADRDGMLAWLNRRFAHHEGFDFQITTLDGRRVFSNPRMENRRLPIPLLAETDRLLYGTTARVGPDRWRMVSMKTHGPDEGLVVQVARNLEAFDHETGELLATLLLTGPMTLLAAMLGGYFLARRALAPVDRMTRTAARVSARQLDERLEVVHPGDELGHLAHTLNEMIERLGCSLREMQRFTADASHELRTPIAIIRAEAEVSLHRPLDDHEKQNLLGSILEECERLTHITEQLLALSREDAGIGRSAMESVDLAGLVEEVAETMRPLAVARSLELKTAARGKPITQGDPARLRQVFYNLLDNAIKYTPPSGAVEVHTEAAGSTARVSVRDTGIGIPQEHLPHVFDRFYRVDKARSRAEGGAGLGLSIVESIVTAHGGRVEMQSAAGRGTTCMVSLPMNHSVRPEE